MIAARAFRCSCRRPARSRPLSSMYAWPVRPHHPSVVGGEVSPRRGRPHRAPPDRDAGPQASPPRPSRWFATALQRLRWVRSRRGVPIARTPPSTSWTRAGVRRAAVPIRGLIMGSMQRSRRQSPPPYWHRQHGHARKRSTDPSDRWLWAADSERLSRLAQAVSTDLLRRSPPARHLRVAEIPPSDLLPLRPFRRI